MKKLIASVAFSALLLTACGNDNDGIAEIPPAKAYISDNGTTVQVTEEAVSLDSESPESTAALVDEETELDWEMIFEEDCIVIGEEKYPAYMKICTLSENFKLGVISQDSEFPDNPDLVIDYYTLYYLDKKACGISAVRTADLKPTDSYIYSWTFGGFDEMPMEQLGMFGFSMSQSADEIAAVYTPDQKSDGSVNYYGVTEYDNQLFGCSLSHSDGFLTTLTITPYNINPSVYEYYKDK